MPRASSFWAHRAGFVHTSTFRIAGAFALTFSLSALILFAFIFWQTAGLEGRRINQLIETQSAELARAPHDELLWAIQSHLAAQLHRIAFIALFDAYHDLRLGDLRVYPAQLRADGRAQSVRVNWTEEGATHSELVRAVARVLPDGNILVVARTSEEIVNLRQVVMRALALGVIPTVLLSLLGGAYFSVQAMRRAQRVHQTLQRIMDGNLSERLPARDSGDHFDQLAGNVNLLLDELQSLLAEVKAVNDDIAHDLRGPLTRMRVRLERASLRATSVEEFRAAVVDSLQALDRAIGVIAALLRIGEIENRGRRAAFSSIDLADLVHEVADVFEPAAESRGLRFLQRLENVGPIEGDKDLLLEALVNLVDNALKYTPSGGAVEVAVLPGPTGAILRVSDTGVGIAADERNAVLRPYYRSNRTRHVAGTGVGLSLVAAVVRLHGFMLDVRDGTPGTVFEIHCRRMPAGRLIPVTGGIPGPERTPFGPAPDLSGI